MFPSFKQRMNKQVDSEGLSAVLNSNINHRPAKHRNIQDNFESIQSWTINNSDVNLRDERTVSIAREETELLLFANLLESLTHPHSGILNILNNCLLFVCVLLHCCSSSKPQQGPLPAFRLGRGSFHVTKDFEKVTLV